MITTEFIKLYEDLSTLNEAKQDRVNFTNWIRKYASSEMDAMKLADRFDVLKSALKAPENDYYYWIKNNDYLGLNNILNKIEHDRDTKKLDKEKIAAGVELVNETEHWKIYHITNYEAARVYGRDSKWCITGINNAGDHYWRDYTARGFEFYFIITKENYNPRGWESKFAIALNTSYDYKEIYDQEDNKVDFEDIPYYEEVEIPGINIENFSDETPSICDDCGEIISEGDEYYTDNGQVLCGDCYNNLYFRCAYCTREFSQEDANEGTDGILYCSDCWAENFFTCENCYDTYDITDYREGADGSWYCPDCWENLFYECDNCNEVGYLEDAVKLNDGSLVCADCAVTLAEDEEETDEGE